MAAEPTEQGRGCDYKSAAVVKGFNSLPLLTDIFHTEDGHFGNDERNDPLLLISSLHFSKDFQKQCNVCSREAGREDAIIIVF